MDNSKKKLIASINTFERLGWKEIDQLFEEDRGKVRSFQEKFFYSAYSEVYGHPNREIYLTFHVLDPKKYGRDEDAIWSAGLQVCDKDDVDECGLCIDIRISKGILLDINEVREIADKIVSFIFRDIFKTKE